MPELSPTMRSAINYARNFNNKIVRYPGGYWARENWSGSSEHYFGTTTIQALVSRGLAEYTQWQEGKSRFPIEITLTELALANKESE